MRDDNTPDFPAGLLIGMLDNAKTGW